MVSCIICCCLCVCENWKCCEEVENEDVDTNECGHDCLEMKCLVVVLIFVAEERDGGG